MSSDEGEADVAKRSTMARKHAETATVMPQDDHEQPRMAVLSPRLVLKPRDGRKGHASQTASNPSRDKQN